MSMPLASTLRERFTQLRSRDSDDKCRQCKPDQCAQDLSGPVGAAFPNRAKWRGRGKYDRGARSKSAAEPCQQGDQQ